jgi:hypothetical protein
MFKKEDWEGLMEILSAVDPYIKREELAKYPEYLCRYHDIILAETEETEEKINT